MTRNTLPIPAAMFFKISAIINLLPFKILHKETSVKQKRSENRSSRTKNKKNIRKNDNRGLIKFHFRYGKPVKGRFPLCSSTAGLSDAHQQQTRTAAQNQETISWDRQQDCEIARLRDGERGLSDKSDKSDGRGRRSNERGRHPLTTDH